jgi:hypothetical protein
MKGRKRTTTRYNKDEKITNLGKLEMARYDSNERGNSFVMAAPEEGNEEEREEERNSVTVNGNYSSRKIQGMKMRMTQTMRASAKRMKIMRLHYKRTWMKMEGNMTS